MSTPTLTPTAATGGKSIPLTMVSVPDIRRHRRGGLEAALDEAGLHGEFVADQLSAILTHERCGAHLYRTAAGLTANPVLASRYRHFGDETVELSPHLRSRHEVGRVLRDSGVPVLEFRASIVIGPGSLSFEMIRALVERLPIMVTPRWLRVIAQPIAIDDLLAYLEAALDLEMPESRVVYEIGGAERVSYGELMREYARQRGLRRLMLPVPVLTPWLSSLWLGLVTPQFLSKNRKYAILLCFVAAAILTPTPDAFNQLLMAGPLILLYEAGIVCSRVFGRRKTVAA